MYKSRFRKNWEIVLCSCSTKVIFKMFIFHKTSFLESSSLCCSRPERFHQRERLAFRLGEIIWFPPMICKNSTLDLKREVCFLLAQNCCGCPLLIMSWIKPRSTRKFIFKDENLTKLHTLGVVAARRKKKVCSNLLPIFHPDEPIVRPCKMRDMPRRESLSLWKFLRTLIYRKVQKRSSKKYCAKV